MVVALRCEQMSVTFINGHCLYRVVVLHSYRINTYIRSQHRNRTKLRKKIQQKYYDGVMHYQFSVRTLQNWVTTRKALFKICSLLLCVLVVGSPSSGFTVVDPLFVCMCEALCNFFFLLSIVHNFFRRFIKCKCIVLSLVHATEWMN